MTLLLLLLLGSPQGAGGGAPQGASDTERPPESDAIALAERAMSEYQAGQFGSALLDYQGAYDLDPVPELIFNMAQCQRSLKHWERAGFLFRRYMNERPESPNREKIEALATQMEEAEAAAEPKLPEAQAAPPSEAPPAEAPPEAPPPAPNATPPEDAVLLTHRAMVEYNGGEFGAALLDYHSAYALDPMPEIDFDMGQCERMLHHWDRAAALYRHYLAGRPEAGNKARVDALIAQMQQREQQEQAEAQAPEEPETPSAAQTAAADGTADGGSPAPAAATEQQTASPAPHRTMRWVAWVLDGLGASLLAGGGGLGIAVLAQPDHPVGNPPLHSLTYGQLQNINMEGTLGVGLAIGGAVLLGSGIALGLTGK